MKVRISLLIIFILSIQSCTKEHFQDVYLLDDSKKNVLKDNIVVPVEIYENGILKQKYFYENGRVSKLLQYNGDNVIEKIYQYDLIQNRQISILNGITSTLDYKFDKEGNIISLSSSQFSTDVVNYTFNNNRVIQVSSINRSNIGESISVSQYTYNSNNLISSTNTSSTETDLNGIVTFSYNSKDNYKWLSSNKFVRETICDCIEWSKLTEDLNLSIKNPRLYMNFSPFNASRIIENREKMSEKVVLVGPITTYIKPFVQISEAEVVSAQGSIRKVITINKNIVKNKNNFPISYTSEVKTYDASGVLINTTVKEIAYKYVTLNKSMQVL
jgi:hypothetical protein